MNEHFVGLKSCLPSSTSSNDKARIRIGHFVTGFVLCAVGPILTHFPARTRNTERWEEGWRGGKKRSYLVSFTTKQQPVRRSKSHSFRNRIPTTNAAVIYLQTFITLLMQTKIHSSPFEVWKIRSLPLERNVNRTRAQFLKRSGNFSSPKPYIKIKNQKINPVTARVLDGDLRGYFNFWVSGQNPMVWPFKWKLSSCTCTWC